MEELTGISTKEEVMGNIMEIVKWFQENWVAISASLLLLLRFAESVAAITPTDKDNKIIAAIKEFFRFG